MRARRLLLGYCALLVVSWTVWALRPPLGASGGSGRDPHAIVSWRERAAAVRPAGAPGSPERLPLLLIHGSPGSLADFEHLMPLLSLDRRVLAPDLPGFGHDPVARGDHSAAGYAADLATFLRQRGIERAHVVGYSFGGAVAIELSARAPEQLASLTLVSSIGVQELELFGRRELNRAAHLALCGAVTLAKWLVPHCGSFEHQPLNTAFAESFADTDQTGLRATLLAWDGPAFLIHGQRDALVPIEAAAEHQRLLPQAEAHVYADRGHLLPQREGQLVADSLAAFLEQVESGAARTRATAEPERLARAAEPFDPASVPPLAGPALWTLALVIVLATLISEDLTCIAAGLLVAQGRLGFGAGAAACWLGIYLGDVLLFLVGRWFGRAAVAHAPLRWVLSPATVTWASEWFEKRGTKAVFLSRLMPGLRLPTYFAAGMLHTRFATFALAFALADLLWTPLLVGGSAWAGERALEHLAWVEAHPLLALAIVATALSILERVVLRLFTWRGRRQLVGAWRRLTRFEFWPPWAFYPPLVAYIAWLALKHRSLTLPTACNPGIESGGFIGEEKHRILGTLAQAGPGVARFALVAVGSAPGERLERAREFMRREALGFPIVLKPNVGQRGSGVRIVKSADELERRLEALTCDALLQEFVAGPEFGVFYVRHPRDQRGRIFSITEKRLPVLLGDGRRPLEELILADARAVCAAETYFQANAGRLEWVPAAGEPVELVELGTHCRGAIFLDGRALATPELERQIERLSRGFPGFYFGRYDLRARSAEELAAGRGFKVVELNGLTSEATHVYDPRTPLLEAYRVLFEQWSLAFELGRANRARGAPLTAPGELVRRWRAYRRMQRGHATS